MFGYIGILSIWRIGVVIFKPSNYISGSLTNIRAFTAFQKISNLLEKNGFPLNYINRQIQHFLAKKQSKKPKTDKKDETKQIFVKLPYRKEMNGHIPKEINGFLKKLDFKVTFILINETFNLKRLFAF